MMDVAFLSQHLFVDAFNGGWAVLLMDHDVATTMQSPAFLQYVLELTYKAIMLLARILSTIHLEKIVGLFCWT